MSEDTSIPRSSTETLVSSLRIIADEDYMQSDDGVASMAILEAADRLERLIQAEIILSDLATEWWRDKINNVDIGASVPMGDRIIEYWKNAKEEL